MKEKRIKFVLNHYKDGLKTPEEALVSVYEKAGIVRNNITSTYWRRLVLPAVGIAASLLLVVSVAIGRRNAWTEYYAEASKAVVTLSEGTVITLSPGSMAKVQKRKDPRHVELNGSAYFEVARDESHPFTVAAGEAAVKVLGTKFLVSKGLDGTSVDVTEGKVLFSAAGTDSGLILTKGMSATLPKEQDIPALIEDALPNPAAWATGEFNYQQTSLEDALTELASFYGVNLSTDNDSDLSLSFSGRFSTESLEDIIYAIESALDVKINKR